MSPRRALALSVVLLASSRASSAPARASSAPLRFTLEVSPTSGTEADTYQAVVQIELPGVVGPDRYTPPDFGDFQVLSSKINQGTASVVDPARGQSIRTTIIRRYELRPRKVGRLRIKPARLREGGQDAETDEAWVTVRGARDGAGAAAADPAASGPSGTLPPDPHGAPMFIHASVDRRDPWVGQQVLVTWSLYTRSEVLKFEPKPPGQIGYTSETVFEPDAYFSYEEALLGGTSYRAALVSKRAVFPSRSGRLEIAPFEARIATLATPLGRPVLLHSHALALEPRPLPAGAPTGFDPSYVGRFTISAAVDRAEIDASESLTLALTIEGQGNIRSLGAPKLTLPGFAFRAPRDDPPSVTLVDAVVSGKRVFRYWTTPERGGPQELPPITLAFFDPVSGRYDRASTRPIPLLVRGDPGKVAGPARNGRDNVISRDIRLLHAGDTIASRAAPLLYREGWFWGLIALPPFLFALVVATDRIRQRLRRETPRARLRRARGKARQHFRLAEIHLKGNRPAKFFGELSRALYEHLEERMGQPIQSMTRNELREFLRGKGFEREVIDSIDVELEQFDFARFAPSMAGPGEMRAAQRKVRDLLKQVERTRLSEEAVAP